MQWWRGVFLRVTDAAEQGHRAVVHRLAPARRSLGGPSHAAYDRIREVGDAAFVAVDQLVGLVAALLPLRGLDIERNRLALLSAVNGAFGDRLAAAGNPLALDMSLRRVDGEQVLLTPDGLRTALGQPRKRLVILIHGLGMNDQQWRRPGGSDFGSRLAAEQGYSALYLRYNSGLHISENGRELACLLERLVEVYPRRLERLVLVGHSMGGLVARSAGHYGREADYRWARKLTELVCLGSPHLGAPLERLGNAITAGLTRTQATAPLAQIGRLRSAGVKDLRYGFLVDEDWRGRDPDQLERVAPRSLEPLAGVRQYLAAASLGRRHGDFADRWFGDLLVPVKSATVTSAKPSRALHARDQDGRIFFGMNHFEIMYHPQVYTTLASWLSQSGLIGAIRRRGQRRHAGSG